MAYLTRDAILSADDLATRVVSTPEWGGEVLVRGLSGKERDDYESSLLVMKGNTASLKLSNARAKLVSLGVIDENGKKVFSPSDVQRLGEKSAQALDRVATEIQKLSGLTEEDLSQLTANFTAGLTDGSTSS
jgi:hypothetical protein